jgi:phosphoserine phosphatase
VAKIFAAIEEVARISREIVENVLSFNLYGLFRISTIRHMKKSIYQTVINECPDFLNAFKLITYQGKTPASLRENERINQKMELINVFFKINLPF